MKKTFISLVFIGAFASYAFYNYFSTNAANASATSPATTVTDSSAANAAVSTGTVSSGAANSNTAPVISSPTQAAPVATPVVKKSTGQYTDGAYTGSVADAYYGNVQVRVTVSGGKITNVSFLQYPNDRGTSVAINRQAMPMLSSEAIQAQSANVNGVSGASDTSAAFKESLASALSQAKA
jgi:uncharacterized protein with FMN-binding domain